jgi:hypothetical protein
MWTFLSLSDDEEDTMEQHVGQLQVLGALMKFKRCLSLSYFVLHVVPEV